MRTIPDFDIELAQASNYIMCSELAHRALEEPPFGSYSNIILCILENIDRLADNCHMPEFTNHALPHICSIVKRASEWGNNDGWLRKISPKEAGYLLIALLIHDIGMLSQDAKDVPETERMSYLKGFSDISNWVRRTHVLRIGGLTKRLLNDYIKADASLTEHLDIAIGMAASHAKWAWESDFVSEKLTIAKFGMDEKRIAALNAIIAVSDLLDEDANRCDTVTLIEHRHGTTENMAHWIRHAITVEVGEVNKHCIHVKMRKLLPEQKYMDQVYRVLRNHYRLTKLYNEALGTLDAAIEKIIFDPQDGIPDLEDETSHRLTVWQKIPELKDALPEQLLQTFMPEALNQECKDENLRIRLNAAGLENVDLTGVQDYITPKTIVMPEEKVLFGKGSRTEHYAYIHHVVEEAYLNGNIGKVRHLCMAVIENLEPQTSLDEVYWALIFLLVCMKSESDHYIVDNCYPNKLYDTSPGQLKENLVVDGSSYQQPLDVLLQIEKPMISEQWLEEYADHLYEMNWDGIRDDLASRLLFQTIIGLSWFFTDGKELWCEIADFFIKHLQERAFSFAEVILQTKMRLQFQNDILEVPDRVPNDQSGENKFQNDFAKAWIDFYAADWRKVKEDAGYLINAAKYNQDYLCTAQGYLNLTSVACRWNDLEKEKSGFDSVYTGVYRYQRIIMEQPLPSFWSSREMAIESLIARCKEQPLESTTERLHLLRLTVLRQLDALAYWNLGEHIESIRNMAMYDYLVGVYFDKKGNYCGMEDVLPDIIINAIRSINDKLFNKQEQQKIISCLVKYNPEGLESVVSYITERCPKLEWRYAEEWLEFLVEHMNREQAKRIVDWVVRTNDFYKNQKTFFNLKRYSYLKLFLEKSYLDEGDFRVLDAIFTSKFQNDSMYRTNSDLCMAILKTAPKSQAVQYLNKMLHYEENEWKHRIVYAVCINVSNARDDMKDELHRFVKQCREKGDCTLYNDLDELIDTKNLGELQTINISQLKEILQSDLKVLSTKMEGYDSTILKETLDNFRNKNWKLASDEAVQEIVDILTAFLAEHEQNLNVYSFYNICQVLQEIERTSSNTVKNNIVSYFIDHYVKEERQYKYSAVEEKYADGPFCNFHIDFGADGLFESSVMMILLTGITQIKETEIQKKCICWSMDDTTQQNLEMYYYTTMICGYFYFMGNDVIKYTAFSGLMLIYGSLQIEDEKYEQRKHWAETAIHNLEERIEWFDGKSFQSRVKEETAFVQKVFEGIG